MLQLQLMLIFLCALHWAEVGQESAIMYSDAGGVEKVKKEKDNVQI